MKSMRLVVDRLLVLDGRGCGGALICMGSNRRPTGLKSRLFYRQRLVDLADGGMYFGPGGVALQLAVRFCQQSGSFPEVGVRYGLRHFLPPP